MEFFKKRNLGEVIGDTFSFYRENFREIFRVGWIFLLIFLLGWLVSLIGFKSLIELIIKSVQGGGTPSAPELGSLAFVFLGFFILGIGLYLFQLAQNALIVLKAKNEEATPEAIKSEIKYAFFRVFFGSILIVLAIMVGVGIIIGIIVGLITVALESMGDGLGIFAAFVNMILQLVIPAIIAPPIIFFPIILLYKRKGTMNSISEAFKTHFKNFWSNFLTYFVLSLIQGIAAGVFMIIFYVIVLVTIFIDFDPNNPDLLLNKVPTFFIIGAIGLPIIFIVAAFAALILQFGMGIQYFSNEEKAEGVSEIDELKSLIDNGDKPDNSQNTTSF
jgi:MFS family permease